MTSIKLILMEDVENLGEAGDEVNVAAGYARNYLLPRKKAMKASPGAIRQLASKREKIKEQRKLELDQAKVLAEKINNSEISIAMQASEDDHLYGSVNERSIAEALEAQGIKLDYHKIKMEDHIRELGLFNVDIALHSEVVAKAKVWVIRA